MRTAYCFSICTLLIAILCAAPAIGNQNDADETFVVIKAGRVITLAGEEIVNGQIVLVDGKIRLVGKDLEYPKSAKVIDARREVVMPGMIHPRTRWQLPSYSRSGIHADRSPAKEIYFDEIDFQPLLQSGFTAVCFYPAGTGIPGPGVVYRTGGNKEQRELGSAYLRVTMSSPGRDKKTLRDVVDRARKEIEKVEKARKEWEEKQKKAKEEAAKKEASDKDGKPAPDAKDQPDAPDQKNNDQKDNDQRNEEKKDDETAKPDPEKPETFTPPKIDPAVAPLVDWIRDKKGLPLLFELSRASDLHHLDDVRKLLHLVGVAHDDTHGQRPVVFAGLTRSLRVSPCVANSLQGIPSVQQIVHAGLLQQGRNDFRLCQFVEIKLRFLQHDSSPLTSPSIFALFSARNECP